MIPAIIAAGAVGGYLQGESARKAANTSAAAQLESARIAAEAAKFRPVGITTRYGSSNFQTDAQGNIVGAGYDVSPELRAYQDQLRGLTEQQLQQGLMGPQQYAPLTGAATGLFNLGSQYLAETPEQAAEKYMLSQQNLLAPSRERQYAQLQNNLFNTGRGGLSVGGTGLRPGGGLGLSASNPEMEAYYNALAQQDAQLAAQAQEAGQRQTAFGAGLFGSGSQLLGQYQAGQIGALSPFQTSLGLGGTIEQMGQTPLDISAQLGGRTATAGANVAQSLLTGGLNAARTAQAGNAFNPLANVLQGIGTSPYAYDYLRGMGTTQSQFTPQQFQQQQAANYGSGNAGFD
ncbi:hypothetical protein UFOVP1626_29 [uncultured Caudovirales phage]|uniref:Uncharacterized protein n=1 Tax=uncultured Caudovirales phage TaxID=2100421 RepID=A0A6J5T1U1_9CAUD|nr:hypothetical protein UFOVP1626_29 [uncultured Caudovirales phage]